MKLFGKTVLVGVGLAAACGWSADNRFVLPTETVKFKPGANVELLNKQCLVCHSADYVSTQPALPRATWAAIVQKMREKYGAPITAEQTNGIVEYLGTVYGKRPVTK